MAEQAPPKDKIAAVLAGPMLRRVRADHVVFWLATRSPGDVRIELTPEEEGTRSFEYNVASPEVKWISAAPRLHYALIQVSVHDPLPIDQWISYRLSFRFYDDEAAGWQDHSSWAPDLCYPGRDCPGFLLGSRVRSLLHGSCRKPHASTADALATLDRALQQDFVLDEEPEGEKAAWPSTLMLSGDQIYSDDVAGPMLRAIHGLIDRLGLPNEDLSDLDIPQLTDAVGLYGHRDCYYRRERLLPKLKPHRALYQILFGGVRKPIFTAVSAHNHLITLAEVLAMYLLVWSPAAWDDLDMEIPGGLTQPEVIQFARERRVIESFVAGLASVRRVCAHIPVAMIFDDHDITDDWNLNRDWEETAYGHPFSTRIIGNAIIGYLIHQAWGNNPEAFEDELLDKIDTCLTNPGAPEHDGVIEELMDFEGWDFVWSTEPGLVVLDTRTRRWRSERAAHKPSGLLDWEALTDLQQILRKQSSVMIVSAAPIFGVKLIETVQKLFAWVGKPLMVDAENWMAHPGTAHAILNVFRHPKGPTRFVILSGDVHYSFVYDIEIRGLRGGPDIWQICSSALRNRFPDRLLATLDYLNRWLYSPRSPLNWFTRRRHMRVIPRKPEGISSGRRLLNDASIGLVELDEEGSPWRIRQLMAENGEFITFVRREDESHWG